MYKFVYVSIHDGDECIISYLWQGTTSVAKPGRWHSKNRAYTPDPSEGRGISVWSKVSKKYRDRAGEALEGKQTASTAQRHLAAEPQRLRATREVRGYV